MSRDVAIRVEGIRKTYGGFIGKGVEALKGVSLGVRQGQVFGLLGPNGAGKTTLVKILLGLVRRSGGAAWLLGHEIPSTSVRRNVGYLPEDHVFPDYLTGETCLDFFAALAGVPRAERKQRVPEVLEQVGLSDARSRLVSTYSKGMQQRLGIAQAIVHRPEILFLDEPTDGVDPIGRKMIRDVLIALKAQQTTIFINSHILSEIEKISDGVVILNQGIVVHAGSVEDLTATGNELDVRVDRDGPDVRDAIEKIARIVRPPSPGPAEAGVSFRVALETMEHTDRLVDGLRAARVSIRALVPRKATLEERYIDLMTQAEEAPPPAAAAQPSGDAGKEVRS